MLFAVLGAILALVLLIGAISMLGKAIGNQRKWKAGEPELIRDVEKAVGQKIVDKIVLNASRTMDFSVGKGFLVWLAFTSEYVVLVHRDELADNGGEGHIFVYERKNAGIRPLKKHYAEVEFRGSETSQGPLTLTLLVNPRVYELLAGYMKAR